VKELEEGFVDVLRCSLYRRLVLLYLQHATVVCLAGRDWMEVSSGLLVVYFGCAKFKQGKEEELGKQVKSIYKNHIKQWANAMQAQNT
jgi:hypothetical protein